MLAPILWLFVAPWFSADHTFTCIVYSISLGWALVRAFQARVAYHLATEVQPPDDARVSNTKSLSISVFSNLFPFSRYVVPRRFRTICRPLSDKAGLSLTVQVTVRTQGSSTDGIRVEATLVEDPQDSNVVQVLFGAKAAGTYEITLLSGGLRVADFPCEVVLVPDDACPQFTVVSGFRSSTLVVMTDEEATSIRLEPRDQFGNPCQTGVAASKELVLRFKVKLKQLISEGVSMDVDPSNALIYYKEVKGDDTRRGGQSGRAIKNHHHLFASFAFGPGQAEMWFSAQILLDDTPISMKPFSIIVLSPQNYYEVKSKVDWVLASGDLRPAEEKLSFNVELLPKEAATKGKSSTKKAVCKVGRRSVSLSEYFLWVLPWQTKSFITAPSTSICLARFVEDGRAAVFVEDSLGFRSEVLLPEQGGSTLAAAYSMVLLSLVGGCESFSAKRSAFYQKLIRRGGRRWGPVFTFENYLEVQRDAIVFSSLEATKNYSVNDWLKLFHVHFRGERGVDGGGLRREWFTLLTTELFSPSLGLFVRTEEGHDAVMPNPHAPEELVRKGLFPFAGRVVAKMLSDSSQSDNWDSQVFLPVRLARSFLAQMAGLPVGLNHLAADMPGFYSYKARLILRTNMDDPEAVASACLEDLAFTDEDESSGAANRRQLKTTNLISKGSAVRVTEANKLDYLRLLAQHRLCKRAKAHADQFFGGFREMVPEELLFAFDEPELELLLCGIWKYDVDDLKAHHDRTGGSGPDEDRTLEWLWLALKNFTDEQMAKFLQFATSSCRLPAEGFAGLRPKFKIAVQGPRNSLPTAHTCVNLLTLAVHDTFASFERALLNAIVDGGDAFAFS